MNRTIIAIITTFALLAGGFAAVPALAGGHDSDNERGPRGDRGDRAEARSERHAEMKEARDNFTSTMRGSGQAHRECAPGAGRDAGDDDDHDDDSTGNETGNATGNETGNATGNETGNTTASTDGNTTGEDLRACHEEVRDRLHEMRLDARMHFQEAKQRAQEKYRESLHGSRDGYLQSQGEARGCKQSEECIERQIARLETQKERAVSLKTGFEDRLATLQTEQNNTTSGNESYHVQDAIYGAQIKILQMERLIFRIDARIEQWTALLDDGDDDTGSGNETAE